LVHGVLLGFWHARNAQFAPAGGLRQRGGQKQIVAYSLLVRNRIVALRDKPAKRGSNLSICGGF